VIIHYLVRLCSGHCATLILAPPRYRSPILATDDAEQYALVESNTHRMISCLDMSDLLCVLCGRDNAAERICIVEIAELAALRAAFSAKK
jgi:hypothetical protein